MGSASPSDSDASYIGPHMFVSGTFLILPKTGEQMPKKTWDNFQHYLSQQFQPQCIPVCFHVRKCMHRKKNKDAIFLEKSTLNVFTKWHLLYYDDKTQHCGFVALRHWHEKKNCHTSPVWSIIVTLAYALVHLAVLNFTDCKSTTHIGM